MGDTVSDLSERGRDIATDMIDDVGASLEQSMRARPLATIAIAVGLGFIVGALWRR
jgi:hypothetical protein